MIFIFGNQRCGSTAVASYIDNVFIEPHNHYMLNYEHSPIREHVLNSDDKIKELQTLGYDGFKEVFPTISQEKASEFIKQCDKTVILVRNNLFAQALSVCISLKIDKWHGESNFVSEYKIGKINVSVFQYQIREINRHNNYLYNLSRKNKNAKMFVYENLFENVGDSQIRAWKELCQHLDIEFNTKKLRGINKTRYNSIETHCSIPNIEELREQYFMYVYGFGRQK